MWRQAGSGLIRENDTTPIEQGGDRAANSALQIIAIRRFRLDSKTKEYVARRTTEGHSKLEAFRCLKRYIAREVFNIIVKHHKQINQAQIAA
jgi:transposase|tara:strand:- start:93 stop:368 length:276 start_codon:yes stop_codon:yes gene_type:complete